MVKEAQAGDKTIIVSDGIFDLKAIYQTTKSTLESMGYGVVESSQSNKPKKYGAERKMTLQGFKDIDEFGQSQIDVNFNFEALKTIKKDKLVIDNGDGSINFKCVVRLDYQNHWGTTSFKRFLFKYYSGLLKKEDLKKKYIVPSAIEMTKLYEKIKEMMQFYN